MHATSAGSPLEHRAAHLRMVDWAGVVRCNRLTCQGVGAQHGPNPESHAEVALDWGLTQGLEQTFAAVLDFLWVCQNRSPFLFENGGTFAELARGVAQEVLRELVPARRKVALVGVADYVIGRLERAAMVEIVEGMWMPVTFRPGMRVKTLRGTAVGMVLSCGADGLVLWRPKGSATDLVAQPESLLRAGG